MSENSKIQTLTPVVKEVLADLETPLSSYLKLANAKNTFLLESVTGGEVWGRYSIIGLECEESIHITGDQIVRYQGSTIAEEIHSDEPLNWLEQELKRFHISSSNHDLPLFEGGLVGYFGYNSIEYIEPRLRKITKQPSRLSLPDILLLVSKELVIFDNLLGKIFFVILTDNQQSGAAEAAQQKIAQRLEQLRQPLPSIEPPQTSPVTQQNVTHTSFSQEEFIAAVEQAKQLIVEGDIMQVVLSQQLACDYPHHPLHLYRALRYLNPSPYMFYFNFGDHQVVGTSPEILVRQEQDQVTVRPIAGTRKRGADPAEDKELAKDLLQDPKELAEHLMLIDLGRNDISRVCQSGTVKVTEQMTIEHYSHVMHIVSNVCGKTDNNYTSLDIFKATFPAGTVSGAPKVRAMEVIKMLEPISRDVFGGAVGYLSWNGNMDTAIAIRTGVIKDGRVTVQAGAGIVADSIAENEWQETMNKAQALIKAAEIVSTGLES